MDTMIATLEGRIAGINDSIAWLAERGIETVPETLTRLATLEDVLRDAKKIKTQQDNLTLWKELKETAA